MNKEIFSFPVTDTGRVKMQMLGWVSRFNICCFLDSQCYDSPHSQFECMAAADTLATYRPATGQGLAGLNEFLAGHPGFKFGHLGYGLGYEAASLAAPRWTDPVGFGDIFLFVPRFLLLLSGGRLEIHCPPGTNATVLAEEIFALPAPEPSPAAGPAAPPLQSRLSRRQYLDQVRAIQQHIHRGDCYEMNFCQEFFSWYPAMEPARVYQALTRLSPNPFAAFYRLGERYLLCSSPERFLKKSGDRLVSQPIKGTWKRDLAAGGQDGKGRAELAASAKDRAENVMVVDLVRNDLARVCRPGTVKVEELFGIYTFPQVHQMISTVSGELQPGQGLAEILRACFPMGSMTGAPKLRVMELIGQYESGCRGLFSGSVGYIGPEGDFDFNVVIRSILYNAATGYLSCPAGSGITAYSNPEAEYQECLLKAAAIKKVLE